MSASTIICKNTDRASRPVDLSTGASLDPGAIGEVPNDDHTADLIGAGRLTKVRHVSSSTEVVAPPDPEPAPDVEPDKPVEPAHKSRARHPKES